jgi:hypothetical protein
MTSVSTISIYYDEENYIKIAKNLAYHSKTKCFVVHLKYIQLTKIGRIERSSACCLQYNQVPTYSQKLWEKENLCNAKT